MVAGYGPGALSDDLFGNKSEPMVAVCGAFNQVGDGWYGAQPSYHITDKAVALKLAQDIIDAVSVAWPEQGEEGGEK